MGIQKNNRGSTLVLVLIIVAVFTLLATAMGNFAINENKHAIRQQKRIQAYYIARAGAEATAEWMMGMKLDEIKRLSYPVRSEEKNFGDGLFQIEITMDENQNVIVKSTGKVSDGKYFNGKIRYVEEISSLVLNKKLLGGTISQFDVAVFGENSITSRNQGNGGIVGNIATNSTGTATIWLSGKKDKVDTALVPFCENKESIVSGSNKPKIVDYTDNKRCYPSPTMPNFSTIPISDSIYNSLTVNTNEGDVIIRVKELNLLGDNYIKVIGTNKLIIYVDEKFIMKGNSSINPNGNSSMVQIYYNGSNKLDFKGNITINASLYINKANISLDGSHTITGDIITGGNNVEIKNKVDTESLELSPRLIYAPNASVLIENGNQIFKGAIIGKNVTISNTVVELEENTILTSKIQIIVHEEKGSETDVYTKGYWK